MPIFCGDSLDGWLYRSESHFEVNGLKDKEKLEVVGVSLDGDALVCLQ